MDEKDKKIARLEELLQSIKDNIDETESVLDSLSNSELQAENDNDLPDDEFDRLLDEFIQSQLSERRMTPFRCTSIQRSKNTDALKKLT